MHASGHGRTVGGVISAALKAKRCQDDGAGGVVASAFHHRGGCPVLSTIAELRAELREAVGRAEFREKNMRFRSIAIADDDAPDRDSHATVRISAHDCGRVLDNLLANAIHATGGDGVVTVSLRDVPPDMVRLSVHDNGPGMPPDFDRAFDRFS